MDGDEVDDIRFGPDRDGHHRQGFGLGGVGKAEKRAAADAFKPGSS
jgi:hypothetical protein